MEKFKDPKLAKQSIDDLKEKINLANDKYYNLQSPEITDTEYDLLIKELISLEDKYPNLKTKDSPTKNVGTLPQSSFDQVVHKDEMLSLSNVFDIEELNTWKKKNEKSLGLIINDYVIEEKIDGLAISLTYKSGILIKGATRGNGKEGEDITQNLKTIKSIPIRLAGSNFPEEVEVRGEVFFPINSFKDFNTERKNNGENEYSNTRNAASGALRQLNPEETSKRPLDAFFYSLGNVSNLQIDSQKQLLEQLKLWGLNTNPNTSFISNFDQAGSILENKIKDRYLLNYSIDGLVVKVDSLELQEILGNTSKDPRWATAIKFPASLTETTLIDIKVGLGRSGVLTPYAVLKEVVLDGVSIKSASLHNIDYIQSKDLRIGDNVLIQRAGDVIPQVVRQSENNLRDSNSKEFLMPLDCPSCSYKLIKHENEPFTRCINSECPEQTKRVIQHYASKQCLDIEGLGEGIIKQLFDSNIIKSIQDLYIIKKEDLANIDGFGDKSISNLLASIEESKTNPLNRILHGLGIPHVGSEISETLSIYFNSFDNIFSASKDDLENIDGIGPKISDSITLWYSNIKNQNLLKDLKSNGITHEQVSNDVKKGPLSGENICVTGQLNSFSREEIKNLIITSGGKFHATVTNKTTILISGEKSGSKLQKAQELKINIINEEEFKILISYRVHT